MAATAKPPVLRQSTAFERISHGFYMKADSTLVLLCARTAVFNAPDNLEKTLILANQLTDDQNTEVAAQQTASIEKFGL